MARTRPDRHCKVDPFMGLSDTLTDNSRGSSRVFDISQKGACFYRLKLRVHVTYDIYRFNPFHATVKIIRNMSLHYASAESKY